MTPNPLALNYATEAIKTFESCRLTAYLDSVGIPTIGWGETEGVRLGMTWTQEQADAKLQARVLQFMTDILSVCQSLNSEENAYRLAACTSLAYNIGMGNFRNSSVAKFVNAGDYVSAAQSFLLWNKAGGKVLQGLVNRREAEKKLFEKQ
jgi:lysozyme